MIEVRVGGLAVDSRGQPVVILEPVAADNGVRTLLPIWIGAQEAAAIMLVAQGETPPRPLVYDLMATLIDRLDARVQQVAVTKLEEGTFYAEITLRTDAGDEVIDARPSDSIALAVRTGAPVFVSEAVFAQAGVTDIASASGEESEVEAFHEFLESVDPDDFRG